MGSKKLGGGDKSSSGSGKSATTMKPQDAGASMKAMKPHRSGMSTKTMKPHGSGMSTKPGQTPVVQ